jgi:phosphoribosylglycinamide formyltransferase-1
MPARLGILLSGSGSTYENLAAHCADGRLDAEIAVVVASRSKAGGCERAQRLGHHVVVAKESDAVTEALRAARCDWVLMCGWLRPYDPPPEFAGRVLNIHPSLLPAFGGKGMYGRHVHEAVFASGIPLSGCTVHLVEGDYDSGPVLAQRVVSIRGLEGPDAIATVVQEAERHLYPLVCESLLTYGIDGTGRQRSLRPVAGCDADDRGFVEAGD